MFNIVGPLSEDSGKTTRQMFDSLVYEDYCDDALLVDVCRYLRRSVLLEIPPEWRDALPSWLS